MGKMRFVLASVACCGIAGAGMQFLSGQPAAAQQQLREGREAATSPQTDMKTKELWKQIGRLHSQIVALELQNDAAGSSAAGRPRTGAGAAQLDERPETGRTAFGGAGEETEELWMQVAQVHKQIVAKQATNGEDRTSFFRGGTPDRGRPSAEEERQPNASDLGARSSSPVDPLWQRYVQLQQQIVAADVKKAKDQPGQGSSTGVRDRNADPRQGNRNLQDRDNDADELDNE